MKKCFRVFFILGFILGSIFSTNLLAQDPGTPDTLWIGKGGGSGLYNGTSFVISVSVFNDEPITAISIPFAVKEISAFGRLDSVTYVGTRLEDLNILDVRAFDSSGIDSTSPDSAMISFLTTTGQDLPVGDGKICDLWFSGGPIGGTVNIDSITWKLGQELVFVIRPAQGFVPLFSGGDVLLKPKAPSLILPAGPLIIDAGDTLSFAVSASGNDPISISLDSLRDFFDASRVPFVTPSFSGGNPGTFDWEPDCVDAGLWRAHFTATDDNSQTASGYVDIYVRFNPDNCNFFRMDANCDRLVRLTDVIFIINYLFKNGAKPCPPSK
ncbi:MAG: hypothetical protein RBG1_1C00001G1023 [candidate division Zixibacteria bacterium RBG-1]|nr:MAG: hypothetical protein RBG1_1C00001G1023 [candidate division Zixibacteria bacterium RBG-1]OGC85728.1 MAG: hypothetical protein A2V73_01455 [candidate division Zixibacteria bacterium RBG_19FT_COMBO_42_43]